MSSQVDKFKYLRGHLYYITVGTVRIGSPMKTRGRSKLFRFCRFVLLIEAKSRFPDLPGTEKVLPQFGDQCAGLGRELRYATIAFASVCFM